MKEKHKQQATIFRALSDENRLEILELLTDGEKCGCVLLEKLHIQQPTLSHHMKILYQAGLVEKYRSGKWTHYSLNSNTSKILHTLSELYSLPKE